MSSARLLAVSALQQVEARSTFLDSIRRSLLTESQLSPVDRRFFTELTAGTIRRKNAVDFAIEQFSKQTVPELPGITRSILRIGAYQLLFLPSIPARAVVHEMVDAAHHFSHRGTAGYVNAVLRRMASQKDQVPWPHAQDDPAAYITITASYPKWLAENWIKQWGPVQAVQLADAMNEAPRPAARHNPLQISRNCLEQQLKDAQVWERASDWVPDAFVAKNHQSLIEHPGLAAGWYYIQSESSCLPPYAGQLLPGLRVLDMCSAPGGKTTHMATLMENTGSITALDRNPRRLRRLQENVERLGVSIVNAIAADAATFTDQPFDRVFLDAPCSGLGTLGHKPDIRWHKSPEQVRSVIDLQQKLLRQAAALTKKAGLLIYSTCTTEYSENEGQIVWFLENHPEFSLEPLPSWFPVHANVGMLQILPHVHHSDGFFIAVVRRRS